MVSSVTVQEMDWSQQGMSSVIKLFRGGQYYLGVIELAVYILENYHM